jgi:hypothetical protein
MNPYSLPRSNKSIQINLKKGTVMSFFSKILDKLGLHKEEEKPVAAAPAASKPAAPAPAPKPAVAPAAKPAVAAPKPVAVPAAQPATPAVQAHDFTKDVEYAPRKEEAPAPKPISEVDVVKHLEELSKGKNLNWKTSIVDLLKLLDLDSSYEARVELAKELNCPEELMGDSAKMNTWLHKEVLRKIAENGGNIPKDLLD